MYIAGSVSSEVNVYLLEGLSRDSKRANVRDEAVLAACVMAVVCLVGTSESNA